MPSSNCSRSQPKIQHQFHLLLVFFCFVLSLALTQGCADDKQQTTVNLEDPVEDFDWVMQRLKRITQPVSGGGLNITDRKLEHELFPPDDKNPHYTATVTISTETSYLHNKRPAKEEEKEPKEDDSESGNIDLVTGEPLSEDDIELKKLINNSNKGPKIAGARADQVETFSFADKSVFQLKYTKGHWQLVNQPDEKYQQKWFEYALQ